METSTYGLPEKSTVYLTCAECLVLSADFKIDHPDEAKEIINWINNNE